MFEKNHRKKLNLGENYFLFVREIWVKNEESKEIQLQKGDKDKSESG